MERKAFSQYINPDDAETDRDKVLDELRREFSTRKRLYDRWVAEGQMTWTEGNDRMRCLIGAIVGLSGKPAF